MAEIITVTDGNFEEQVLASDKPVLVDIWAPWCAPCRAMEPIVKEIAAEHDQILVAKLNADENTVTVQRYGVRSIPTMMLFSKGQMQRRMPGAYEKSRLEKELSQWLS